MANVEPQAVQALYEQIEAEGKAIREAGSEGRAQLEAINVEKALAALRDGGGKYDPGKWSGLPEAERQKLYAQLVQIHDGIRGISDRNGPRDGKHLMYDAYASTFSSVLWLVLVCALTVGLLDLIVTRWNAANGTDFSQKIAAAANAQRDAKAAEDAWNAARVKALEAQARKAAEEKQAGAASTSSAPGAPVPEVKLAADREQEAKVQKAAAERLSVEAVRAIHEGGTSEDAVLEMVVLLGALGGALHFLGSLVKFIGNRQLKRSWLPYYLAMPFTGAGLALIVYMLLRVGLITPTGTGAAGAGLAHLNLMAVYAFAVLSGLFSRAATEKLGEVFGTVFKTGAPPSKDPVGAKKPPGDAAATPGAAP